MTGTAATATGSGRDWPLGLALFAALFATYASGACRTIYVGDSGELVTAVYLPGIPHPTGYPLYVLLGKLWTLALPLGSIAWRMSLFSAAAGAGAGALLYASARALGLGRVAALFGALLLAFSPSFWAEANVQRVYTLGAMFVAAATWAAIRWRREPSGRRLALVAFLCGLGAANHTYMAIFAAAFAIAAVLHEPALALRFRQLFAAGAAFVAGLLPYVYLPLRSRQDPALDWGNPESLDRFLAVLTRREFWQRRWLEAPRDLLPIAADWLTSFPVELGWAATLLAVVGLGAAVSRRRLPPHRRALALFATLALLGNLLALALHGSRSDLFIWHRYYIPSYLLGALLAACGLETLAALVAEPRAAWRKVLPTLFLAIPLWQLAGGWRVQDRSRYRLAEDYSRRLLASLPPGADLAASDDNILFVLLYLHHVEGLRPDVHLIAQGVGDAALPSLRFDPAASRLFFTHHPNWNLPELEIVPEGLVFHVVGRGILPRQIDLGSRRLEGEDDPRVPRDYLTQNLVGEFHFMLGLNLERTSLRAAAEEFANAAAAAPDNDVLHYNLGLVYERQGDLDAALAAFERSQAINPRHLAGKGEVRALDRVAELRRRIAAGSISPRQVHSPPRAR